MSATRFRLDDLHVGQRFRSGSLTVDEAEMVAFAKAYDPQPFHLDDAAAKGTLFGRLAASGWYTAALSMRLLVEGGLPVAPGIIGTGGELLWPKPVHAGDTLSVEVEVLELTPSRSKPDRGTAIVRCLTTNQLGEVVQSFSPKLVLARTVRAGA